MPVGAASCPAAILRRFNSSSKRCAFLVSGSLRARRARAALSEAIAVSLSAPRPRSNSLSLNPRS